MSNSSSSWHDQVATQSLPLPNAHEIAIGIVRRDQRRTRLLAILCLVLWVVAVAGMVLMIVGLNEFLMGVRLGNARRFWQPPVASNPDTSKTSSPTKTEPSADSSKEGPANDQTAPAGPPYYWDDGTGLFHHTLPLVLGSMIVLLLAGATTVLLVFSSRRTTLNRINLSLAQIAEQLKSLSPPAAPSARASSVASAAPPTPSTAG